jgi:hypothetical protein
MPKIEGLWWIELREADGRVDDDTRFYAESPEIAFNRAYGAFCEANRPPVSADPSAVTIYHTSLTGRRKIVAHRGPFEGWEKLLLLCHGIGQAGLVHWRKAHPVAPEPAPAGEERRPWCVELQRGPGTTRYACANGSTPTDACDAARAAWSSRSRPECVVVSYLREGNSAMLAHQGQFEGWDALAKLCEEIGKTGLFRWRYQHGIDLRTKYRRRAEKRKIRRAQDDTVDRLVQSKE